MSTKRNRASRPTKGPTKGPWVEFSDEGRTVAILPAMRDGEVCNFRTPYPSRANARLIAASPDLLEACRLFDEAARDAVRELNAAGLPCPSTIALAAEQARHAIAKATGAEGR